MFYKAKQFYLRLRNYPFHYNDKMEHIRDQVIDGCLFKSRKIFTLDLR